MAVGGFVVGASAVAAVIGLHTVFDNDDSKFLRGANRSSPGSTAPTPVNTSASDKSSQFLLSKASAIGTPTVAPSSSVPTFRPSIDTTTPFPTNIPTVDGEFPTQVPTVESEVSKSELFTSLSIRRNNEIGFRLKLSWEVGYFWQERTEETWWCMACPDGKCEENTVLEIRNCRKKSDKDATFVVTSHGDAGYQFRVANTDLCLQKMGSRRIIKLKSCNNAKKLALQLFAGFKTDERFELHAVTDTDRCLSQHHHPKSREKIYAERCHKAIRTKTSYWVTY